MRQPNIIDDVTKDIESVKAHQIRLEQAVVLQTNINFINKSYTDFVQLCKPHQT